MLQNYGFPGLKIPFFIDQHLAINGRFHSLTLHSRETSDVAVFILPGAD